MADLLEKTFDTGRNIYHTGYNLGGGIINTTKGITKLLLGIPSYLIAAPIKIKLGEIYDEPYDKSVKLLTGGTKDLINGLLMLGGGTLGVIGLSTSIISGALSAGKFFIPIKIEKVNLDKCSPDIKSKISCDSTGKECTLNIESLKNASPGEIDNFVKEANQCGIKIKK